MIVAAKRRVPAAGCARSPGKRYGKAYMTGYTRTQPMGAIETRTFRSGNSVAVRLPKSFGLPAGTAMTMEQADDTVTVGPVVDMVERRRKPTELIARLRDVRGDALRPTTSPLEGRMKFPDRPEL